MKRNVRASLVAISLGIAAAVALAGCSAPPTGGGGAAPSGSRPAANTVVEKNFAFEPNTLNVKVGDPVTFSNQDTAPHNVKIDNKELGQQSPGQDVTWTATKDGTFTFSCLIHPTMAGRVIVGSGGASTPAPTGKPTAPSGGYGY